MCTLVVAARVVAGFPLVVVANRDEQLDRSASPPFRWSDGFVAPRDDVAGGTWLGLNDAGVFVAITNRYLGPRDPARTSRGSLVVEALRRSSAREIHAAMADVDPARFNGFHLVYADERDVLATISDGRESARLALGDGLSIVTERSFGAGSRGDDDRARKSRITAAWERTLAGGFDPERMTRLLTEHDPDDRLASTCIHLDELRYGTRSSMVLAVGEVPTKTRMLWADGPPCTTAFRHIDLGHSRSAADALKTG